MANTTCTTIVVMQTSQLQNIENMETDVKKIWRLIDRQTKPS